jgi:hypothetical protein
MHLHGVLGEYVRGKGSRLQVVTVVSDILCGEGKGNITCDPVPYTGTKRLIQEHCFYGCFTLQDKWSEIFKARHGQDGIETKFRNRRFIERFCAEPNPTQTSRVQKRELERFSFPIVGVGEMHYELSG